MYTEENNSKERWKRQLNRPTKSAPFTTLGQNTRRGYSTDPRAPHGKSGLECVPEMGVQFTSQRRHGHRSRGVTVGARLPSIRGH